MTVADRLPKIRTDLLKASRSWASGDKTVLTRISSLREEAIRLNHAHYFENIPIYRKLVLAENYGKDIDLGTIKQKLMLDAGIFKSYNQAWLDEDDYTAMTEWLSGIFHRRIAMDMSGIVTIDGWIDRLGFDNIHLVYSSGTSGCFSFVPREKQSWQTSRALNITSLAPLLLGRVNTGFAGKLLKSAVGKLSPEAIIKLAGKKGLSDYVAIFLGFKGGRMGNQALIQELSTLFSPCYYLYDIEITGSSLRSLWRGAKNDIQQQMVHRLQYEVNEQKEANYQRVIDKLELSAKAGQKVFIFGAPYQLKELLEIMGTSNRQLNLAKGSLVLFGGGWKTFAGEAVSRDNLIESIASNMGIRSEMILEGYSMTEINLLMLRCSYGCFHIPPVIEPMLFNEEFNPLQSGHGKGVFGFLDPLATDYPGFIITRDYVTMVDGACDCGLAGQAITKIERMPGSEVKGCGGVMGSLTI